MTGLSGKIIAELVAEVGPVWQARQDARLSDRPRRRAPGAGAKYKLVFVDRLLATLVHLRHSSTHDVLAAWFGVDRSTITRAINEIRPLLADRGCRVEQGIRLRTVADVVAYLDSVRQTALMDATEIRVRRPTVKRAGRHQFISGKSRQNAMKALMITDAQGRVLFCGATTRGSTADITQARQAGVTDWLEHTMAVEILTDAGYQGLGAQTCGQVLTPMLKHHKKRLERMPGIGELRVAQRKSHARRRVRVEHGIAHLKNWGSLARHLGCRESLDDTVRAIAGLLSDQQRIDRPQRKPVAALTASAM
ncbi:transposase family protein [Saccharopolyspora elongata]|uniref:Transposase n=1 Tax=Saccharopolyspora elongata TaxID=2530387 RepID=A0A4R4XSN9_9PSEU|nr:transposase family protein [Saccharopolyspora elongata]TDD33612.1 transposase [Saccharopolyspora elongata]